MKQYKLFLLSSLIISAYFIAVVLLSNDENFSISVHDTYFVICKLHIWASMIALLLIINLAYYILHRLKRKLKKMLFIIHYLFTFLPFVAIYLLYSNAFIINQELTYSLTCMLLTMFVLGQLLFLISILISKKTV